MDIKARSSILERVDSTSSPFFSHNIHNKLSERNKMETKCALKDPQNLKIHPYYASIGMIGFYGYIQEDYSILFS